MENSLDFPPRSVKLYPMNNYSIKVRAQFNEKIIDGDLLVSTNRWIDSYKRVKNLEKGDTFLYNGAWYDVEKIELVK